MLGWEQARLLHVKISSSAHLRRHVGTEGPYECIKRFQNPEGSKVQERQLLQLGTELIHNKQSLIALSLLQS